MSYPNNPFVRFTTSAFLVVSLKLLFKDSTSEDEAQAEEAVVVRRRDAAAARYAAAPRVEVPATTTYHAVGTR